MPIVYDPEKKRWRCADITEEEKNALAELGAVFVTRLIAERVGTIVMEAHEKQQEMDPLEKSLSKENEDQIESFEKAIAAGLKPKNKV
jgi:hypothetical protein